MFYYDSHFYYKFIIKSKIILKVYLTDLTLVRDILLSTYQPRGETPWDPVCLFRSYWLMCQYGNNGSISDWVDNLKSDPFWAILSGFEPDNVPGVGTFYDFEDRLCDFDKGQRVERTQKLRDTQSKPQTTYKKNEKAPPKSTGIVEKIVERIIRDEDKPQPQRPDDLLHLIFKECFVRPSAHKGLIGNLDNLAVCGDGTLCETGASPYATKECDCRQNGNYNCDCPGKFSDPDANWGWDSHREKYVYGYSNYTFTAADSSHNLPIFSTLALASRHDSVHAVYSLYRMKLLYSEFDFGSVILDSAHDNYATYELLDHWNIEPFIELNKRNKGNFKYDPPIDVTDEGIPICKGGFKMVNWGPDYKNRRRKWRCPHVTLKGCTCSEFNCTDSDYGRTVHTKFDWDLRIFTPTPRDSKKWNETMDKRSSSERRNSQVKNDYNLEYDKVRSKSRWLIRTIMRDATIHVNTWVKEKDIEPKEWIKTWLNIDENIAA